MNTNVFRIQTCEKLINFSADFAETDCEGNWYGLADKYIGSNNFQYNPSLNVQGVLEINSIPLETTETEEGKVTKISQSERGFFKTWGIPKEIVDKIVNYLMQRPFYIDNEIWDSVEGIEKNNDNGDNWWLETQVERKICDRDLYDCD
jgi:hypothetical protein